MISVGRCDFCDELIYKRFCLLLENLLIIAFMMFVLILNEICIFSGE